MFISFALACLLLGAFAGFMAGLLGIGGGLIIVPVLLYLLPLMDISQALIMPMAIATSLATIIVTSTSAALVHHKNKNIPWRLAKPMALVVGLGASVGAFIADALSIEALTNFFAGGVIVLASYMFFSIVNQTQRPLPSQPILLLIGLITGVIASLMGIAGGAILVPVLSYCGMALRQVIGLSTVCGVSVAVFGSLGFIWTGFNKLDLPDYSLGYVYLPALLCIIIASSPFAKLGVKMATRLPVKSLKRIFAIFLIIVAIKMMLS
ncbi:MAG: sulfite exporter TauE/SafE family protein [Thalassotalea sp.]